MGTKNTQAPKIDLSIAPNPATQSTRVAFNLTKRGETTVELLDLTGAVARRLAQGELSAGPQAVDLNTTGLATGLYFVRVQSGNQTGVKKVAVLRGVE